MVGNVGALVEAMNAANNAKMNQTSASASTKSNAFSEYLDTLLLNGNSGLFSGTSALGLSSLNSSSSSIWQMAAFEALKERLKKEEQAEEESQATKSESAASGQEKAKNTEWAKIRVVERYKSPAKDAGEPAKGIYA